MEELIRPSSGYVEFPTFNNHLRGLNENRYTYILEFMSENIFGKEQSWPILKYDHQKKEVVSKWS